MEIAELAVWTLMAGGLLTLLIVALADTVMSVGIASLRQLLFVVLISLQCVLLSGLAEFWLPGLPQSLLTIFKVGIGPLGSALGLRLMGLWLGGDREDQLVRVTTIWGTRALQLAALALMLAASGQSEADRPHLLLIAAAVTIAPVGPGIVIALRAHVQGDPLSRWMALNCAVLGVMIAGLHLRALQLTPFGLGSAGLTAISAIVFLLITMGLSVVRERDNRRLIRLAQLETGVEPATGLPAGTKLLAEVEHALWRAGRKQGKCILMCVYLSNLYEPAEALGHTVDNQILAATAARIRRAVGFRCVVGLYHPRCFIIMFTIDKNSLFDARISRRLRSLVSRPLRLVGPKDQRQTFVPRVGLSVQSVAPDQAQALDLINEAEWLAIVHTPPPNEGADHHSTLPQELMEQ